MTALGNLMVITIVLVILIATLFYGSYSVRKAIDLEKKALFGKSKNDRPISNADLDSLPPKLRSFLIKAGVIGKCVESNASFKQQGHIKTARNKKWRHFKATQYMSSKTLGFIWSATSFPLFIRDKSVNGVGEVKVNLLGFKDVARFSGATINESALTRCLGELMFFPVGFLNKDILWEIQSHEALKASLKVNDVVANGIFYFNAEGLLYRFESKRYMGDTLENFTGMADDYKMMNEVYIPSKMKAIWNLDQGDFEYFNAQITDYRID